MITGWLADEDCPDCGGPLMEIGTSAQFVTLECSTCDYRIRWLVTDFGESDPADLGSGDA